MSPKSKSILTSERIFLGEKRYKLKDENKNVCSSFWLENRFLSHPIHSSKAAQVG
jgi:hypothetical protein